MATIMKGPRDSHVKKLKAILEAYEQKFPGSSATLYRNEEAKIRPGPVRIRVVDDRFAKWSKPKRHDEVWQFISDQLTDDELQDISVLLLLSPREVQSSFMNAEFDDPAR